MQKQTINSVSKKVKNLKRKTELRWICTLILFIVIDIFIRHIFSALDSVKTSIVELQKKPTATAKGDQELRASKPRVDQESAGWLDKAIREKLGAP